MSIRKTKAFGSRERQMAFILRVHRTEQEGIPTNLQSYSNLQQFNSSTIVSMIMPGEIVVVLMRRRVAKHVYFIGAMRRQNQSSQAEWKLR